MHCKNCGAQYRTRELVCPYCGTENALGRIWMVQRSEAEKEYEKARAEAGKGLSVYVLNRVLSRILVILTLVVVLSLLGFVLYSKIQSAARYYKAVETDDVVAEANRLSTRFEDFQNCRLGFLLTPEDEKKKDDYYFEYSIRIGIRLLEQASPNSSGTVLEDGTDYEEICKDVEAYFLGVLGMTHDELDSIRTVDSMPLTDERALIDALWERGAWK